MVLGSLAKTLWEKEEEMKLFKKRKENGENGVENQTLDRAFQSYSREFFANEQARFAQTTEAAKLEKARRGGREYTR